MNIRQPRLSVSVFHVIVIVCVDVGRGGYQGVLVSGIPPRCFGREWVCAPHTHNAYIISSFLPTACRLRRGFTKGSFAQHPSMVNNI